MGRWVFGPLGWGDMDEIERRVRMVEESITGMPSQIRVPAGWGDMDEFEERLRVVEDSVGSMSVLIHTIGEGFLLHEDGGLFLI